MKSIKRIIDDVIDLAMENMYSEIETWHDEDGAGHKINLSPKPEFYEKLRVYFSELYVENAIDVLKNFYNQQKSKISGR